MEGRGSYAPVTVVPAVAPTKNGCLPCSFTRRIALSSSSGTMDPHSSQFTGIMLSVPIPRTAAALA
eukprot:scaffold431_cov334-Pavlova_lutheri.AAC.84